jgi:hypothetical protein
MKTSTLRALMKAAIPDARVASPGDGSWTIRFKSSDHRKTVRALIKELGLVELFHDVEGSRWDWGYVWHVMVKE